ncbi:Bcr/CflA family multidrug efflux MFS transporter [Corallincola platygyrae]|uniref:Bcr/CflA family efflux transporter n=1 Tax=Corallincola platygyrae TaxID=1193278 RepID=A0ABW4XJ92_9GAMM
MWRTILLLASIVALTPLAIDMYLPAMPAIAESLGAHLSVIQGSMSTFLVGFAIGQLIHGPLTDALGRRPIALAGLTIFCASSLLLTFADSSSMFLVLRVFQALGGAAGSVVINATITDRYKGHEAVQVRSTIIMVMTLAPMLAPTLGGGLLHWFGWRSIFAVLTAWSVVTLIWSAASLKESNRNTHALSFSNVRLSYTSVIKQPLLWPWLSGLSLNSAAFFAFLGASPYVYIKVMGISPQHFGFYFAANVVVMTLGAAFNSRLSRLFGAQQVLRTAQKIQITALSLMLLLHLLDLLSLWTLVPLCAIYMGLNSFVFPNATSLLMEKFSEKAGTTSALLGAAQFGTGALSTFLVAQGTDHGASAMIVMMFAGGISAFLLVGVGCRKLNGHS